MEFTKLTALELGQKIQKREVLVEEVTQAYLDYIKKQDAIYNCFITQLEEESMIRAKQVQQKIDNGELKDSPLAGVPMALKDNICTKGIRTTCASKMLENFLPTYNARVVEKLEEAGAILVGKTNMDEFAMGGSSETSYFGPTKNPINIDCVPGGSSGGSAAAVAAKQVLYTLGTDTGGSIRQPSSFCGVTGIKPTYGTVSRYGLIPYASSFDQIGPMAGNISDATAVLDIIKGYDKKDSTSIKTKYPSYRKALIDDVKDMRIGIPKNYIEGGQNEQVKEKIYEAAELLREKGAIIDYFDLENDKYIIPIYYAISSAEASANLSKYDGIKYGYRSPNFTNIDDIYTKSRSEGFGDEVKLRILLGTYVLGADNYEKYYNKALKIRGLIKEEFDQIFSKYDIILEPSTTSTAPKFGHYNDNPTKRYAEDIFTIAVNLLGLPAISIPCGFDKEGLPIGLQLIGKNFGEKDIIRAAYSYERTREN